MNPPSSASFSFEPVFLVLAVAAGYGYVRLWKRVERPGPWRAAVFFFALGMLVLAQPVVDALLFSSKPLYGRYAHPADPLFGISPLTDQRLAGVVMMTEQLLTLGICVALLLRPYLRERRTRARPAFS